MREYLDLVKTILRAPEDAWKGNRTGIRAKSISGYMLQHNMKNGFPLLTTKKMGLKNIAVELEGFLHGVTDKSWYQKRGCHIWDEWCNPEKVPYGTDDESKLKMFGENDLGPIYGYQWRDFNMDYRVDKVGEKGVVRSSACDQVAMVIDKLKNNPSDRRMIVSAWNPEQLSQMALPPCHLLWQVVVTGKNYDTLNLNWYQRSCDTMLGIPYNLASYGLLMHLLCLHAKMKPGKLCGMLGDVHIYENQMENAEIQVRRVPRPHPGIEICDFKSVLDFTHKQVKIINYDHAPRLDFPMAV